MAFYLHCRICWPIRTYMHMYVCTVYVWLRLLLVAVSLPSRSTPPENWGKCNIHMAIRLEHREKFYVQKTILFNISFCLPNNIVISKALFLIERTMSSSALESSMRCVQCSCLFYRSDVNTYATQNSTLYICHGNNLFLFSLFCQKFVTSRTKENRTGNTTWQVQKATANKQHSDGAAYINQINFVGEPTCAILWHPLATPSCSHTRHPRSLGGGKVRFNCKDAAAFGIAIRG